MTDGAEIPEQAYEDVYRDANPDEAAGSTDGGGDDTEAALPEDKAEDGSIDLMEATEPGGPAEAGHEVTPDVYLDVPVLNVDEIELEADDLRARVALPCVANLPVREKRILYMRYFQDMTQTMIAEELGLSQMHVSRLITRTCARLRKEATGTAA